MARILALLCSLSLCACRAGTIEPGDEVAPADRRGTEIEVCGRLFDTGTRVVLWDDPGGYDAYATGPVLTAEGPAGLRYAENRGLERSDLGALRDVVELFVVHYDACGTSRECFRILHDVRKLSVHFLLDVDGTLYQTLDLEEQAWHARHANRRSVGVEVAQVGAVPAERAEELSAWYSATGDDVRLTFPARLAPGVPEGFDGRAARPELFVGEIHGRRLVQHDFTAAQYDALERLASALTRVFPSMELDAPRGADGAVLRSALTPDELAAFRGVIGHLHVTEDKVDPGPAFDWESFLAGARARAGG